LRIKEPVQTRASEISEYADQDERRYPRIKAAHGSFDNDVLVVTRTLERIRGGALDVDVENLHGF
jgi:hypothetical protein